MERDRELTEAGLIGKGCLIAACANAAGGWSEWTDEQSRRAIVGGLRYLDRKGIQRGETYLTPSGDCPSDPEIDRDQPATTNSKGINVRGWN